MRRWQFWLGVAISVVFLALVLRDLDLSAFWTEVQRANYWWLLPGVLVYFVGVGVRAWRWQFLLRPLKRVPLASSFRLTAIGYMGNNVYPARAGELLRAALLKRNEGISISAGLATIIVERIFDGVVMLAFIFVNLGKLARLSGGTSLSGGFSIQQIALWGTIAFLGALALFLLGAMFPTHSERLMESVVRVLPASLQTRFFEVGRRFLEGLAALRSPVEALMVFATSLLIWLLETGKYWFVMQAFDFEVSFFALMLMNGVVNLATTIPSAPGYVGTFDAPGIAVLEAYGVPSAVATSYTFVLHVALWLPITALGAFYLAREGFNIGELPEEAEARP